MQTSPNQRQISARTPRPPQLRPIVHPAMLPRRKQSYPWDSRQKEKRMTIAAGFVVQDGIVLCADTKYSGSMKVDRTKLFPTRFDSSLSVVFALAGHEGYGKMAAEDCNDAIAAIDPSARSAIRVKRAIRGVVSGINRNYIDVMPTPSDREDARFNLLAAVWHEIDGLHLFQVLRTSIVEVASHECIGIGDYLAGYLIGHPPPMDARMAIILATHMLSALKSYDANCGGYSQFITLRPDGTITQSKWYDSKVGDDHVFAYEQEVRRLLFA